MMFSIIVVTLNAGEKLKQTVDSILAQSYADYEIVVKDGGSRDGSVESLPGDSRISLYTEPDKGIYDAMNQAVQKAKGDYLLFLNCGDLFYDTEVLKRTAGRIEKEGAGQRLILYGDTYWAKNGVRIAAPGHIDGAACYRNIPCHQSCFYAAELCREKPYDQGYRIRADYDHFLWCYYQAGAKMVYLDFTVSSYEGGGYSESRENRARDREEHRLITEKYMSEDELAKYRRAMKLTCAPLRSFLAENRWTSGNYHWLKDCFYHHKLRIFMGILLLAVELGAFFGTGIMLEEITNYHTGEGSYEEQQSDEANSFCQEFQPVYRDLHLVSFLMSKDDVTVQDGTVTVLISDGDNQILYEKTLGFEEVADGYFTDLEVNVKLKPKKSYYLSLITAPSSKGEYPTVGLCSKSYYLPENRTLLHEDEMPDAQLVSRYRYENALPVSKIRNIIIICVLTALGIMFGLPENKYLRKAAGIAILLAGPYMLGSRLEMLTYKELYYLPIALKWNVGIMYGIELIILLVTQSSRVTIALTNIALTLLYTANYFVIMYRGTPLRVNDFSAIGTAAEVVGEYRFVPNDHLAMAWAVLLLFVVFGVQTGTKKKKRSRNYLILRGISYAVSIAMALGITAYGGYRLLYTDLLTEAGFADEEFRGFYQDMIYSIDGYLVGTCIEVRNARITPPEGYSVEGVKEILAAAAETEEGQILLSEEEKADLPHVILIMNESFSDLRVLGDLELNMENMEFFNSLQENTVRGYVNASVIGGGTANSEFEVFTGCSTAFFPPSYYPYQQGVRRPLNSFISQMEKCGYTTHSMHPEPATNWKRNTVYRFFGFDESLWQKDFEGAEEIHSGVSDAETYQKVIEMYENRKEGEKLFIFDLTMQNHGGYPGKDGPYEVQSAKMQNAMIDEYLSLVKISDEAFADLIRYFEKQDEKVIICMFGDHQPWVSNLIVDTDKTAGSVDPDKLLSKYKTPFVIWANYDIEEAEGYDISMNYLGGLLQRTAGIPLSPYFSFLEKQREEYPIITINGYVDGEGKYYNWGSDGTEFPEYRMLQYNYLYDEDTVKWGY